MPKKQSKYYVDLQGDFTFTALKSYSDATAQIIETKYLQAKALTAYGDYAGALAVFNGIKGYKDVESLLANDHNLRVAALDAMYRVGNYVTFGHYPLTSAGTDSTEIQWLVLARDGNKVLLISRYGLDVQPYDIVHEYSTWEKCTLRAWLNEIFLYKAFTEQEQTGILTTYVDNDSNQGYSKWNSEGGNSTLDKVFLLSYAEANLYLGVVDENTNTKSQVIPTEFAIKQGAHTATDGSDIASWWLRSPGRNQNDAATVAINGSISWQDINYTKCCVRPALWINLDFESF